MKDGAASHKACAVLFLSDIAKFYEQLPEGTMVVIFYIAFQLNVAREIAHRRRRRVFLSVARLVFSL
jgi:hypothetical protein